MFIDENLPYHVEAEYGGKKWVKDIPGYWRQVNRLFENINKQMGLEVIVALHPSSNRNQEAYGYCCRDSFYGNTVELVRDAQLLISFGSGSFDFAILGDKPILMYTSCDLEECNINGEVPTNKGRYAKAYRKELPARLYYMDKDTDMPIADYIYYDKSVYQKYMEDFLKPNGTKLHYDAVFQWIKDKNKGEQREKQ